MLSWRGICDEDGRWTHLDLLGDAEKTMEFHADYLRDVDPKYLNRAHDMIILRDDNGRIFRYRITGRDGDIVTGELIPD